MSLRHAAALAVVGWYLMVPPTQEALDSSCSAHPTFSVSGFLLSLLGRETEEQHLNRCDHEGLLFVPEALLSKWSQGGEFETLAECRTEQQRPYTEQEKALAEFTSGFTAKSGISKEDLIRSGEQGIALSKCIASDDPRLKEN
jgi:hypothetical protein